jgi:hypothetical protein
MTVSTPTTAGQVLTSAYVNNNINSGLTYVGGGALSTNSTNFQGCFTSAYRDYRVVIDSFSVASATWVYIRYLSGATPNATANYISAGTGYSANGNFVPRNVPIAGEGYLAFTDTAALGASMQFDISTPLPAQRTFLQGASMNYQAAFTWSSVNFFVLQNEITAFDGFQITTAGGPTISGNVSIYGYRQA